MSKDHGHGFGECGSCAVTGSKLVQDERSPVASSRQSYSMEALEDSNGIDQDYTTNQVVEDQLTTSME